MHKVVIIGGIGSSAGGSVSISFSKSTSLTIGIVKSLKLITPSCWGRRGSFAKGTAVRTNPPVETRLLR